MKVNDGQFNATTSVLDWDRDLRSLGNLGFNLWQIHEGHVKGLSTKTIPPLSEWKHPPTHVGHCHLCGEKHALGMDKPSSCPTCKGPLPNARYKYEVFADGEYRRVCHPCRQVLIATGWRCYLS